MASKSSKNLGPSISNEQEAYISQLEAATLDEWLTAIYASAPSVGVAQEMQSSLSWRITKPLRKLKWFLSTLKNRGASHSDKV